MAEWPSVGLSGSERWPLPDVIDIAPLNAEERAELTLVLRRRAELPEEIIAGPTVLSADELAERYGADPADVDLVCHALTGLGLQITAVHATTRRIKVAGHLGDLSRAFGTTLRQVSSPDHQGRQVTHRYREGPLYVPDALADVVVAVLGLDSRP
jgi:kumamolisin